MKELHVGTREIPSKELKNRMGAALRAVAAGERVLVTRHGKPVAWIIPAEEAAGGAPVRPFEEAWASIEASLAATAAPYETWHAAEDASRRRPQSP